MAADFEDYFKRYRLTVADVAARVGADAGVIAIERIAVKTMQADNEGRLSLPKNAAGEVIQMFLAKACLEIYAFIGALKSGSLTGAYHHVRAEIEVIAAIRYVFKDPLRRDRRIAQHREYKHVAAYLRLARFPTSRKEALKRLEKEAVARANEDRPIPVVDLDARRAYINSIFDDDEATLTAAGITTTLDLAQSANWAALYGPKFEKEPETIRSWHTDVSAIPNLILHADAGYDGLYDIACHATHVSPIGHRNAAAHPHFLGWERGDRTLHRAISIMIHMVRTIVADLDPHCGGQLAEILAPEIASAGAYLEQHDGADT